jgi:phage terminase large subunit
MSVTQVALPDKLIPVFEGPADVRGAWGGRGSAKTRSFAKMAAVWGYKFGNEGITGQIVCGRQFMNTLEDSSLEELKRAIEEEPFLADYYDVGEKYIKSKDGRIWFTFVGLDRNIASIKSKGRILLFWIDEAEPVTDEAFTVLIPTLREEGDGWNAELWVTWNPKRKTAAVEKRFLNSNDPLIKIIMLNWQDNEKFPAKLERERQRDLIERPEEYPHIWEGKHATVIVGAYFATHLLDAERSGRITGVPIDPLMTIRAYCDLGGTGAKADAFSMWIAQFIGQRINVVDYYEAQGQPLATHIQWLRENGYGKANVWLPHDGETNDRINDVSFQSAFQQAGFAVTTIPNQGKGAAKMRIEAARRRFPGIWFDKDKTEAGREALGFYHEKRDENRDIGLGPEHDWSSHGADAFGLMCIAWEPPSDWGSKLNYPSLGKF